MIRHGWLVSGLCLLAKGWFRFDCRGAFAKPLKSAHLILCLFKGHISTASWQSYAFWPSNPEQQPIPAVAVFVFSRNTPYISIVSQKLEIHSRANHKILELQTSMTTRLQGLLNIFRMCQFLSFDTRRDISWWLTSKYNQATSNLVI